MARRQLQTPRTSAPPITATHGIVLHMAASGEAHRVVEVMSAESGRLVCFARGARASRRRFAGILDLFVSLRLELQQPRAGNLPTLAAATATNLRLGLRRHLHALARAAALCACVRALAPLQQAMPALHTLLGAALDQLAHGAQQQSCLAYPRMLALAGLLPQVQCCRCAARDAPLGLAQADAALVCRRCHPPVQALLPATLQALRCGPILALDGPAAGELEATVMTLIGLHQGHAMRPPVYL